MQGDSGDKMTGTYRVGITGAAGYIGSRVTINLLKEGQEVVPVDNFHSPQIDEIPETDIHDVDIRDRGALRRVFGDVDAVMHLAAISGVQECRDDPETAFDVNVTGTENVAWLCREQGVALIFPASMAVIGNPRRFPITSNHPLDPLNLYGLTKAMGMENVEWLARDSFPAHIYIKSNLYGNHYVEEEEVTKHTVINVFVEKALNGESLTVHEPGTQARDFIHVRDVARAYTESLDVLMAGGGSGAETFPLASGECMSVLEIAETVQRVVREERGYEPGIEMVENPRESETEATDFDVDTREAERVIGFEVEHDVESTVREMVG